MIQRTSDAGFSGPFINQEIASWLLDNAMDRQLGEVRRGYREKALAVKGWLTTQLGDVLEECRGGQASFYYYLTLRGIRTDEGSPFFRCLARTTGQGAGGRPRRGEAARASPTFPASSACTPGGRMVEQGKRQLRFSYGYEEMGRLEEAVGYMAEAVPGPPPCVPGFLRGHRLLWK